MHYSFTTWLCLVPLLFMARTSYADIEPVATLADGTGAVLVPMGPDSVQLFHFRRIIWANRLVEPPPEPVGVQIIPPLELPEGAPDDLSEREKIEISGIVRSRTFRGTGLCRPFDIMTIDGLAQRKIENAGVLRPFVDGTVAFPMDGPFPETLPPTTAACVIADGQQYIVSVPELRELRERARTEVPRFVRLVKDSENVWGRGKDFLVYSTLPNNPFWAPIGKHTRIVQLVQTDAGIVTAVSEDGRSASYNLANETWSDLVALLPGDENRIVGAHALDKGHAVLWRTGGGVLMSGTTDGFRRVDGAFAEALPLAGISQLTTSLGAGCLWAAAVREKDGGGQELVVAVRAAAAKTWSPWHRAAGVAQNSNATIAACAAQGEKRLYVAVTERRSGATRVYTLIADADAGAQGMTISGRTDRGEN